MTRRPTYGQVTVGPPGSGKTTYCNGMQQYLRLLGRNAWVINLDPANERITKQEQKMRAGEFKSNQDGNDADANQKDSKVILPYETIFNVCDDVVNITSVMKETGLGPNGGLVYAMEYLETNMDSIIALIEDRLSQQENPYLIFDLPGQVELFTNYTCVQSIMQKLQKAMDLRLTCVQLIDAHYCTDASKFLSATLLGTTTMIRLELPTISVLSKIDLLHSYGELDLALDFYTECQDLDRLVPFVDQSNKIIGINEEDEDDISNDDDYQRARRRRQSSSILQRKFAKLHQALAEVVEDFGLLSFVAPLDISDAASVGRVLAKVDKCNGYVFTQEAANVQTSMFQCAVQQELDYDALQEVKERILEKPKSSSKKKA